MQNEKHDESLHLTANLLRSLVAAELGLFSKSQVKNKKVLYLLRLVFVIVISFTITTMLSSIVKASPNYSQVENHN